MKCAETLILVVEGKCRSSIKRTVHWRHNDTVVGVSIKNVCNTCCLISVGKCCINESILCDDTEKVCCGETELWQWPALVCFLAAAHKTTFLFLRANTMHSNNIFKMDVKGFRKVLQDEFDDSPLFRAEMLFNTPNNSTVTQDELDALRKENARKRAEAGAALELATRDFAESLARERAADGNQGAVAMPNVRIGPFEFDWIVASFKEEEERWVVHDIVECKVRMDDIGRSFLRFQHSLRWLKGWVQHANMGYFAEGTAGSHERFSPASFARFVPSIECKQRFGRDFIVDGLHFVTQGVAANDMSPLGNSADCGKTLHAALNLHAMPKCAPHAGLVRLLKFARKLQKNTAMDNEPCMQYLLSRNIISPLCISPSQ